MVLSLPLAGAEVAYWLADGRDWMFGVVSILIVDESATLVGLVGAAALDDGAEVLAAGVPWELPFLHDRSYSGALFKSLPTRPKETSEVLA